MKLILESSAFISDTAIQVFFSVEDKFLDNKTTQSPFKLDFLSNTHRSV